MKRLGLRDRLAVACCDRFLHKATVQFGETPAAAAEWMRACIDLSGGFWQWLKPLGDEGQAVFEAGAGGGRWMGMYALLRYDTIRYDHLRLSSGRPHSGLGPGPSPPHPK